MLLGAGLFLVRRRGVLQPERECVHRGLWWLLVRRWQSHPDANSDTADSNSANSYTADCNSFTGPSRNACGAARFVEREWKPDSR